MPFNHVHPTSLPLAPLRFTTHPLPSDLLSSSFLK